jgi:hypothetical protein
MRLPRLRRTVVLVVLLSINTLAAEPIGETKVGLQGVYYLRTTQPNLAVRQADERSPLLLSIAGLVREPDALLYELHYIGARAGEHDLRDYLARSDGKELVLPPLTVRVLETLASDHDGSLDTLAVPPRPFHLSYRLALQTILVVWLLATVAILVRQWIRRPRPAPLIVTTSPTLADQLQPLVEAALASRLDAAGQARLEMLLLSHWQSLLELEQLPPDEALRRMRKHTAAGELLRTLEAWLHARPGCRTVDVAALLTPYRGPAKSLEHSLAGSGA